MNISSVRSKRHGFARQIIAHAIWPSFRFPLSLRPVEALLPERRIAVFDETIRRWGKKSGPERCQVTQEQVAG